jgi:hypothetical protein
MRKGRNGPGFPTADGKAMLSPARQIRKIFTDPLWRHMVNWRF